MSSVIKYCQKKLIKIVSRKRYSPITIVTSGAPVTHACAEREQNGIDDGIRQREFGNVDVQLESRRSGT